MISFFGSPTWSPGKLQDLVHFQRGFDITKAEQKDGDIPVISSSGPSSHHNVPKVEGPGVIIGRKGTLGSVFYSEGDYWPHDTTLWSKDLNGNNPRFVYYALKRIDMSLFDTGAANPTLNRNHVHGLPVFIPDRSIQDRIAAILSAYDDLIENNRRRIALLEDAARQLYKEWFVRFRFPGHEHVTMIDGVPANWHRKPLGEVADLVMGQSPQSQFYNLEGNGLPFHQGVTDYGFRFVTHRTYSTMITKLAEPDDILVSVRAPVGRINITHDRIVLGRGLSAIRSKTGNQSFLLYALKDHFYAEDIIGTGAIYAATNKKELEAQLLIIPPARIVEEFEDISAPIDCQIANLSKSIEHLIKARDLLLPKLMNGTLTV